jgi:hypothetical protein
MAAMDKLFGRGLGRARVQQVIERLSEPNGQPPSPADLGRARLEVQLGDGVGEDKVRAMIGSLGATEVVIYAQTSTPFPAVAPAANTTEWYDVAQATRASERGATDASPEAALPVALKIVSTISPRLHRPVTVGRTRFSQGHPRELIWAANRI